MEIGRKAWQSVELPICPSRFDRNGLALNVTGFFETLPKRGQKLHVRISRSRADQANDRHRQLLRAPQTATPPRHRGA
jgi:DNA-binding winged helix-turn-helix (wHTH) protein